MKTFYLSRTIVCLHACFIFSGDLFSQLLSCQTSCPQPGQVFSVRTSSPVSNTAGKNQLWDYSGLWSTSSATQAVSYLDPSQVAGSSNYPNVNLVKVGNSGKTFLNTGTDGIRLALHAGASFTAEPMLLPLPFGYGNTYTEKVTYSTMSGTNTIVSTVNCTVTGIGTGTLILPSSTYQQVVLIKSVSNQSAKMKGVQYGYIYDRISYYYYSPDYPHPLLYTTQLLETGPTDWGPYTEWMDQVVTGSQHALVRDQEYALVPNPATDQVKIRSAATMPCFAEISNALGQVVFRQDLTSTETVIDLRSFPPGMYFVLFTGDNRRANQRLIISR